MRTQYFLVLGAIIGTGFLTLLTLVGTGPETHASPTSPLTKLVDDAAQRLQTADPVAASKYLTGGAVDDPAREMQVIDSVTADAVADHTDAGYVKDIFRNQIDATDSLEHSRFAQWKIDPAQAPTTAPDLSSSRNTIDTLNRAIVVDIAAQWEELHSPTCRTDLEDAKRAVIAQRRLDALYQRALGYATHMYCR
jgi:chorismate mutase